MKHLLNNWIDSLDVQIADLKKEIADRSDSTDKAVEARDDLIMFCDWLRANDLPNPVQHALERCLEWNPYCKSKEK